MVKADDFEALVIDEPGAIEWKGVHTLTDFDITAVENVDELLLIPMRVLMRFGFHNKYNINMKVWATFMEQVRDKMNDNRYHNLRHITDVVQTLGTFLALEKPMSLFTDLDRLIMIVSAIVHDLGHPGTNNLYQVNKKTELAVKYDNKSVLENYHIEESNSLFSELKLLEALNLGEEDQTLLMEGMKDLILYTDMAQHFGLCGTLQDCTKKWKGGDHNVVKEDKIIYMKSLLHLADISNPFKRWSMCKYWSDRVFAEFYWQGDKEKAEELPVSMLCDRDTTWQDESSVNFIDFIVCPFLFASADAFNELLPVCEILAANRQTWTDMTIKRMEETHTGDENKEKREEEVKKWADKSVAFNAKFDELKQSAASGTAA